MQAKQPIQNDKKALTTLLEWIANGLTDDQTVELDANEELLRLIPVLCAYFSRHELIQLVGEQLTVRMIDLNRLELAQNLILERELQHILHTFNEAHISILLFKGPALAYTVYPEAYLRTYHDIDMLIHPDDLPQAHELLLQMGFTFYEEYSANVTNSKRTGFNYVLSRSDSWLEIPIELHTAPHPSEIGTDFEVESLWLRAQRIEVLGEPTLTMHPIDHLLYLCWHYRFHSFTRLLWLYDLVVMLRATGPELDWIELVQAARCQQLATTLYYCLCWCRDMFGVSISTEVFIGLRPPWACRLIVERIAMPNRVATLASSKGQSRRIIAHRAMVDSTGALLKAGMQTLFPSPAAMGRRYMDKSRLTQKFYFLYYFIHPWTTLAKGFRYLFKRRKR
ncbi:MAG TPA: nucleotidyltransferase family protein [Ktedonobacteraceae bacterium]